MTPGEVLFTAEPPTVTTILGRGSPHIMCLCLAQSSCGAMPRCGRGIGALPLRRGLRPGGCEIAERYKVANLTKALVSYRVHANRASDERAGAATPISHRGACVSEDETDPQGDPFDQSTLPVSREQLCRLGVAGSEIEQLGKGTCGVGRGDDAIRVLMKGPRRWRTRHGEAGGSGVLTRRGWRGFISKSIMLGENAEAASQGRYRRLRAVWRCTQRCCCGSFLSLGKAMEADLRQVSENRVRYTHLGLQSE